MGAMCVPAVAIVAANLIALRPARVTARLSAAATLRSE